LVKQRALTRGDTRKWVKQWVLPKGDKGKLVKQWALIKPIPTSSFIEMKEKKKT
jgi:hypothetical protein